MGSGFDDWVYWHFFAITVEGITCHQIKWEDDNGFEYANKIFDYESTGTEKNREEPHSRQLII
jgi:hypothetical protein